MRRVSSLAILCLLLVASAVLAATDALPKVVYRVSEPLLDFHLKPPRLACHYLTLTILGNYEGFDWLSEGWDGPAREEYLLDGKVLYSVDYEPGRERPVGSAGLDVARCAPGEHKVTVRAWAWRKLPGGGHEQVKLVDGSFPVTLDLPLGFSGGPGYSAFISDPHQPVKTHGRVQPLGAKLQLNGKQVPVDENGHFERELPQKGLFVPLEFRLELTKASGDVETSKVFRRAITVAGQKFLHKLRFTLQILLALLALLFVWYLTRRTTESVTGRRPLPRWVALFPFAPLGFVSQRRWKEAWWFSFPVPVLLALGWIARNVTFYNESDPGARIPVLWQWVLHVLRPLIDYSWPFPGVQLLMVLWLVHLFRLRARSSSVGEAGAPRKLTPLGAGLLGLVAVVTVPGLAQFLQRRWKAAWVVTVLAFFAWWLARTQLTGNVLSVLGYTQSWPLSLFYVLRNAWPGAWPAYAVGLAALVDAMLFELRLRHSSAPAQIEEAARPA